MILLIDDEKVVRMITSELLDFLGYEVHACEGGKQAIEFYENHYDEVDLVILDMIMPEMRGNMVFKSLKKIQKDVRVLFLSGYSHDHEIDEILTHGALGFLKKPVSLKELGEKVRAALETAPA